MAYICRKPHLEPGAHPLQGPRVRPQEMYIILKMKQNLTMGPQETGAQSENVARAACHLSWFDGAEQVKTEDQQTREERLGIG